MTTKKDSIAAVELTREEIQNKISEFENLLKEKDRKDKIASIHDFLEVASFSEVENVELYLLKKAKIVKNGETSNTIAPRVNRSNQGTGKNIRFDLKTEHLSDAVLSVLDTTTPKSKEEIFKALGIVEGVEKEVGAASFDSYKTKFNLTVFADLVENGNVIKHGSRVDAKYTKKS